MLSACMGMVFTNAVEKSAENDNKMVNTFFFICEPPRIIFLDNIPCETLIVNQVDTSELKV